MSEERKIILDLLAEGRITADEAEQLLDALDEADPYDLSDSGQVDQVDQGDLGDLGDQLGARADAIAGDLSDRLSKAVSEMAEAGQELPARWAQCSVRSAGRLGLPESRPSRRLSRKCLQIAPCPPSTSQP